MKKNISCSIISLTQFSFAENNINSTFEKESSLYERTFNGENFERNNKSNYWKN